MQKKFVTKERARENTVVWEFEIRAKQMAEQYRMGQPLIVPTRTFRVNQGRLIPKKAPPPKTDMQLSKIMVGLPKTTTIGQQLTLIRHLQDDIALTESYC